MKPTYPCLLWRDAQPETARVAHNIIQRLWIEFLLGFNLRPPFAYQVTTCWPTGIQEQVSREEARQITEEHAVAIATAFDREIQNAKRRWR